MQHAHALGVALGHLGELEQPGGKHAINWWRLSAVFQRWTARRLRAVNPLQRFDTQSGVHFNKQLQAGAIQLRAHTCAFIFP